MLPLKLMYLRTVTKIVRFLVQRPRVVFCCFASNSKQWSDRYIWCMAMCVYILLTLTQFLVVLAFHMAMVYVECLVGPAKQLFVLTF